MMNITRSLAASAGYMSLLVAVPAVAQTAQTITFSGGINGEYVGPTIEGGYTYARNTGRLYSGTAGNPGGDLEGYGNFGGGVASIASTTLNGGFTFAGLDFAAVGQSAIGSQTVTVSGYLAGALVSSDAFTLDTTRGYAYNYSSFSAVNLLGRNVDSLLISLPGTSTSTNYTYAAIDNVRLGAASIAAAAPEPATWVMMILGFGLVGYGLRRRQKVTTRVSYAA